MVVWQGTDRELEKKLNSVLTSGQQINDAKLEYSPLYNNSNGVASTLLKSADVAPSLPLNKDGKRVDAPNFGENLYQDVGLASNRSGYWFDGKQWYGSDDRKIKPPQFGEPTILLDPNDKTNRDQALSIAASTIHRKIGNKCSAQATLTSTSWPPHCSPMTRLRFHVCPHKSSSPLRCNRSNSGGATWLQPSSEKNSSSKKRPDSRAL